MSFIQTNAKFTGSKHSLICHDFFDIIHCSLAPSLFASLIFFPLLLSCFSFLSSYLLLRFKLLLSPSFSPSKLAFLFSPLLLYSSCKSFYSSSLSLTLRCPPRFVSPLLSVFSTSSSFHFLFFFLPTLILLCSVLSFLFSSSPLSFIRVVLWKM